MIPHRVDGYERRSLLLMFDCPGKIDLMEWIRTRTDACYCHRLHWVSCMDEKVVADQLDINESVLIKVRSIRWICHELITVNWTREYLEVSILFTTQFPALFFLRPCFIQDSWDVIYEMTISFPIHVTYTTQRHLIHWSGWPTVYWKRPSNTHSSNNG